MRTARLALALFALSFAACKAREAAPPAPEPPAPVAPVEAAPPPAPPVAPEAEPASTPPESATPAPPPAAPTIAPAKPKPTTAPAAAPPKAAPTAPPIAPPTAVPPPPVAPTTPPKPTAAPTASASNVVDPGGEVVVAATKTGLARIGADKCRVCHKVQHASWAASGHAKRTPPLDCEGCHGPGSEYKALAVMKDPKKARAAGLVDPDAAYCGKCHKGPWDPALLRKAHAHKG